MRGKMIGKHIKRKEIFTCDDWRSSTTEKKNFILLSVTTDRRQRIRRIIFSFSIKSHLLQ